MQIQKAYNAIIYNLPAGTLPGNFWLSDFPDAPGVPDALNWVFPPWLPQKLYIVGAYVGQQEPPNGITGSQFSFGIDRKRLSYRNGVPPYHQGGGDLQWDQLASMWTGKDQEIKRDFAGAPKFVDRSVDSIWIENDTSLFGTTPGYLRTIWFGFNYIVDEDWIPTPAAGWNTIFGPMTGEGASSGWNNYTSVQVIDADWFAYGVGTKTRVTISADHISSAYIGTLVPYTEHQATGMQQLTFGGNAGAIANSAGFIVSDDMPFGIDTTNGVVVTMHLVDGSVRYRKIQPSAKSYYISGDFAASPNGSGYSKSLYPINAIVDIEQFY